MTTARLFASSETEPLRIDPPAEATASSTTRTIAGMVLPWGRAGRTSRGKVRVDDPTAIRLPKDISRVKLLHGHRHEGGKAVGHLIHSEPRDDGLHMTFQIGTGDPATAALTAAAEHVDDGLSVELIDVQIAGGKLTAAALEAVALVPVPAFSDARVDTVTAAASLGDLGTGDHDADDEGSAGVDEPGDDDADPDTDEDDEDTSMGTKNERRARVDAAARVPGSLGAGTRKRTKPADTMTAAAVADVLSAARAGGTLDDTLSAALTDITHTDMLDSEQPGWLGRIWDGRSYQRNFTELVTIKRLTNFRMTGFRVVDKPGVDYWDGDKNEIPSFPMSVEPEDFEAKKIAGGNDIAREWVDFGWTEMIAAYWAAMADSYATLTDQMIAKAIADAAASAGTAADVLRAAALGANHIEVATNAPANYVVMHPDTKLELLDVTRNEEPAYLDQFGRIADPANWRASPLVDAGAVVVGQKSAMDFYELGGSPIRVNAMDIARGGYDYAMFGYATTFLRDDRGIVKVTIGSGSDEG